MGGGGGGGGGGGEGRAERGRGREREADITQEDRRYQNKADIIRCTTCRRRFHSQKEMKMIREGGQKKSKLKMMEGVLEEYVRCVANAV